MCNVNDINIELKSVNICYMLYIAIISLEYLIQLSYNTNTITVIGCNCM